MTAPTDDLDGLVLTGERTLPGIWHEQYWFARHEVAYHVAAALCPGHVVLEVGCGEGYGGELLLDAGARQLLAVDYDERTLRHLARRYPRQLAVRGNAVALPVRDAVVDVVVSLQVVEHLWDQPGFVGECARTLRPGGLLVVSTPNRTTFSPQLATGGRPLNPFHVRELDAGELADLLAPHGDVTVWGVEHGARLAEWETRDGDAVEEQLAVPPERWTEPLRELVTGLTAADFVVLPAVGPSTRDLLAVLRRRA